MQDFLKTKEKDCKCVYSYVLKFSLTTAKVLRNENTAKLLDAQLPISSHSFILTFKIPYFRYVSASILLK